MKRQALIGVCLLALPSLVVAQDLESRLAAYLAPAIADDQLSGSLLIARGDEVVFEASWGLADVEHRVPNVASTPFGIASINKPVTIAIACRLVDEGKLDPADKLSQYIPEFPRADEITISHLLNHRAGIPHRVMDPEEEFLPRTAADMVEMAIAHLAQRAQDHPDGPAAGLLCEPGEVSNYSSGGYSVLARVVEIAGGMSYEELLAHYITGPLDMISTVHPTAGTLIPGRARGYLPGLAGVSAMPQKHLSFLVGAGSLFSTPRDLFRLQRGILAGDLGETAQMALIRDNGFRWNGITGGYRAFADYDKEADITVICLANVHTGAIDRMREDLPKLVAGEEVAAPERLDVEPIELELADASGLVGEYQNEGGRSLSMTIRPNGLFIGDWILIPTSPATFFSPQDYGRVSVVRNDDGSVERLDWDWGGGVMAWNRVD